MLMEEDEQRFPPQNQESQPGKEYLMNPRPLFANPHYKPSNKLKGKVALVAGGDSGIGRSVCYHFAKEGASVAFTYVKGDEDIDAKDTLDIINESKMKGSVDPIAIPTDLRYDHNCKNVVDEVIARYGRMDVLVNLPAVQYYTYSYSLEEITEERLEKGAIVSFTRGLSLHLAEKKIRVNGVAPGPIWTPLETSVLNDEDIAIFGSQVPMNRAGKPYKIAPSYVFLASKDSSYMTGQVLHPN
ncbi:glucose and ribitol dehydrogenase-like protein, partial [Tanacetum coccineum]